MISHLVLEGLLAGMAEAYPDNEAESLVLADYYEEQGAETEADACRYQPISNIIYDNDYCFGCGYGYGYGNSNGNGYGYGYGDGNGYGYGYGDNNGNGNGYGDDNDNNGKGDGNNYGDGYGYV